MSSVEHLLPKDFVGRTIQVHDVVIYPVRRGSSMWLRRMEVAAIEVNERGGYVLVGHDLTAPTMRKVRVTSLDRCVVEVPNG